MNSINLVNAINEMNLVDYAIVGFILLGSINGYRKGLVRGLLCFLSWLAAAVAAYFLSPVAVAWLDKETTVSESLQEIIRHRLPVEAVAEGSFLQGLSLPGFDFSGLMQYVQEVWAASPENTGGLADVLSHQAAILLVHGFVFAILVAGGFIIIHLLIRFFARRTKGTILSLLNRLGGMLFGTGVNIVVVALLVGLLTPWLVLGSWEKGGFLFSLSALVSDSVIAPYFSSLFIRVSAALAGMAL